MTLWHPPNEEDREFTEFARRWALPIAGSIGFALLVLMLWGVAKTTEAVLHAMS